MYRCQIVTHIVSSEASDKLIKIWDAYTGEIMQTLAGHTEGISDVAWSNDGLYLASASDDKTIMIWNIDLVSILSHKIPGLGLLTPYV